MAQEESKKINRNQILTIAVIVILIIAVVYLAIANLSGDGPAVRAGEAEPTDMPDPDATEDEEESEVQRLELEPTPTPFYVTSEDDVRIALDLSSPDYTDYFANDDAWYDYDNEYATYLVEEGQLVGNDHVPSDGVVYWTYNSTPAGNVYVEITTINGDCIGKDHVGVVIRVQSDLTPSGYSLDVACDGTWRFRRYRGSRPSEEIIDWTSADVIETGNEAVNRIAMWAYQGEFQFFINGEYVGAYLDADVPYSSGSFALYVRSIQTYDLPAYFTDFAYWHIPYEQE